MTDAITVLEDAIKNLSDAMRLCDEMGMEFTITVQGKKGAASFGNGYEIEIKEIDGERL